MPAWQVAGGTNLFSSELRPKVHHAAKFVSGPTAVLGTASFMDGETATLCRGQATDDEKSLLDKIIV